MLGARGLAGLQAAYYVSTGLWSLVHRRSFERITGPKQEYWLVRTVGALAVAIGAAMWWITPFTPLQAAGMAFIIVLMGFLGGLVLSAVKRSLGAKDWGTMISGHGGMMDRMDSVSFAAPVFFHLTRYFFEP